MKRFLPVTADDMRELGWDAPDFVYVSGDAYVDHPSFGVAIIGRVLEANGFRVAMLCQPGWRDSRDFTRFGRPKLGFLVSAGNVDSMVSHYTVARRRRGEDAYSPGGKAGLRPDRATIVYCQRVREAYGDIPIIIGGVEASLRRFAHFDYWDDKVRGSILVESGADLLSYGMGERSVVSAAKTLRDGKSLSDSNIPGTCVMVSIPPEGYVVISDAREVGVDKVAYARAHMAIMTQQDPVRGVGVAQRHGDLWLAQRKPDMPLPQSQLDAVYALPYNRAPHPMYDAAGGVPAITEVKFSICATRGCYGGCSFCALGFHQGRIVVSRSHDSVINEAREMIRDPMFKGYIHDVGGPTANFRQPACDQQLKRGACAKRQCLYPKPCPKLRNEPSEFIQLLRKLRTLPGIKKVFVRSGLRYDVMMLDRSEALLNELVRHHISGQLKVAPEHVCAPVLEMMGKPPGALFDSFVRRYRAANEQAGTKQYLVPYLMSSHPGSTLECAAQLAECMRDSGLRPEQVQDFYPTPGTLSTAMFYTGLDPRTMRPVYVARSAHEKAMQRALMQYRLPQNRALVIEALRLAGRPDLIGFGAKCLVRPRELSGRARDSAPSPLPRKRGPRKPRTPGSRRSGKR